MFAVVFTRASLKILTTINDNLSSLHKRLWTTFLRLNFDLQIAPTSANARVN